MSPIKDLLTSDFISELDDLYYKKFPKEWKEKDLYIFHQWGIDICNGKTNRFLRKIGKNEKVTSNYILRANRKIWEVGRVYVVKRGKQQVKMIKQRHKGNFTNEIHTISYGNGEIVGKLKLIRIEPIKKRFRVIETNLFFEVINE